MCDFILEKPLVEHTLQLCQPSVWQCTQQRGTVVECRGSWSSSSLKWEDMVAVWILQFPQSSAFCRQLMFIWSAHLGLVTKHLVGLPLCTQRFRVMTVKVHCCPPLPKRFWEAGRTSSLRCRGLFLKRDSITRVSPSTINIYLVLFSSSLQLSWL